MPENDPRDEQFDEMLRLEFGALRAEREACPGPETLSRYCFGELGEADTAQVKAHIGQCGICDAILYRMKDFGPHRETHSGWRKAWTHPALGYLLALLLVYPAYQGLRPVVPPVQSQSAVEAPTGLSLDVTRGLTEAVVVAQGDHFFLHFFLPGRARETYLALVRDAKGQIIGSEVPLKSWDGQGNFLLFCRSADFPAGQYALELKGPAGAFRLKFSR